MITFKCVCEEIDGIPCDTELHIDGEGYYEGDEMRGIEIVHGDSDISMVIPEWLALAMVDAILAHKEDK